MRIQSSQKQISIQWQMIIKWPYKPQSLQALLESHGHDPRPIHANSRIPIYSIHANHRKKILWPLTHPISTSPYAPNKAKDTWPHLLSTCDNQHIKDLKIALQQSNTPHCPNTTSQHIQPIFHTNQRKGTSTTSHVTQQSGIGYSDARAQTKPMPSKTKTRHPMHTILLNLLSIILFQIWCKTWLWRGRK